MLVEGSHKKILARFLKQKKPTLLTIDTLPFGQIAAEVTSFWGIEINAYYFYGRDVAEGVSKFVELSAHERNQLEWAIIDNVSAYSAWIQPTKRTVRNAHFWATFRPSYLHPTRYQDPKHEFNMQLLKRQLLHVDDDDDGDTQPSSTTLF